MVDVCVNVAVGVGVGVDISTYISFVSNETTELLFNIKPLVFTSNN